MTGNQRFWRFSRFVSLAMLMHVLMLPLFGLYARSGPGRNHLCEAAYRGSLVEIRLLLNAGADPNGDGWLFTPLGDAVSGEQIEAVRLLLARGADPNRFFNKGRKQVTAAKFVRKPNDREAQMIALIRQAGGS